MAERFEVIVVGAGFAGMQMLVKLREVGLSCIALERGSDVGGTWYWNRYPGARCDVPSLDYSVPWDPETDQSWNWSEAFSTQPEILRYINHLADRHDLRRDIRFNLSVNAVTWDEARSFWTVETEQGDTFEARYVVSAAGVLSDPNMPDIPGIQSFKGELYHTGRWPKTTVPLKGKRVAVLGTGSTGVQASTAIAREAEHLYVLQRTAQFSIPCASPPLTEGDLGARKAIYPEHREWQRRSVSGYALPIALPFAMMAAEHSKEQRLENYETAWATGSTAMLSVYGDLGTNADVAQELSDWVRDKIRATVKDPKIAEALCPPQGAYLGSRRIILDTGYYQAFNQDNVTLVDIRQDPIAEITEKGVRLESGTFHELDMLVVATGYDAVTGPLLHMNITGKDGLTLKQAWADGPHSYLGLTVAGFPNLFTITGPSSPSVLSNMIYAIDQHVIWVGDLLAHMHRTGATQIEATQAAQDDWQAHALDTVAGSLRIHDKFSNWYLGANIPGKPRAVLVYQGGLDYYRERCDAIAADNYSGFTIRSAETVDA